ncbi:MAG: NADH:ubiquinone oxidoreductase subunit NDUFA12 [Parvibaculales bacterium]
MQFLKMIFTWWHTQTFGTALFTWQRGICVGEDAQGNKYYVDKKGQSINGKVRRWVVYNGDVEATRVPPEWHGWLHYTVDETPIDKPPVQREWFEEHEVNQTGLDGAHKPHGSLLDGNAKQADSSGYEAWSPK